LLLLRIFRGLLFKPWNDRLFKHHNTQVHIGTQKHKIRKQYTRLAKEKKNKTISFESTQTHRCKNRSKWKLKRRRAKQDIGTYL
jgi:hypothetical protein